MNYLLDTNILSELREPNCDDQVAAWFETVSSSQLYLSVLSVGKIRQGIARLRIRDKEQASVFENWLKRLVQDYHGRIVPINVKVAETWGRLNAADPLPVIDSLLAATALVHDYTLVTRNTRDVKRTEVRLLNPFTP